MKYLGLLSLLLALLGAPLLAQNNSPTYLALGDSVPFGMNITMVEPYSNRPPVSSEFVGYPEIAAAADHISVMNAACPGETSASFLNVALPDNGCNSNHIVPPAEPGYPPVSIPAFKSIMPSPLHTPYTGSQMAFAAAQLKTNKNIKLVTLNIGANDVLLVLPQLEACGSDPACAQGVLGSALTSYSINLGAILTNIRAEYRGTLILMTYYSPLTALNGLTQAVNSAMVAVAATFPNVVIVDGYTAFQLASAASNGDACQAGLLIHLPPSPYDSSPCDIHPSPDGGSLLASLVECYANAQPNVTIASGQTCTFIGNTVTGNIRLTGGSLSATSSTITGNLQVSGGNFSINSSTIGGNLQVQNTPAAGASSQICGTAVLGDLQIQNSAMAIATGNPPACAGNTVGGNLQVQNNTGAEEIAGNTIKGNLQVMNNTAVTQVFGNNVSHNLQCQNNSHLMVAGPNAAAQKQGQCY